MRLEARQAARQRPPSELERYHPLGGVVLALSSRVEGQTDQVVEDVSLRQKVLLERPCHTLTPKRLVALKHKETDVGRQRSQSVTASRKRRYSRHVVTNRFMMEKALWVTSLSDESFLVALELWTCRA